MGSFDFTCTFSNLPIRDGDDVKYLLLTENPYEDRMSACYSHDYYVPRTWPLRAKYNDYGSIDYYDETSPGVYALIEGLKQDLLEVGVGDNTIHDVPAKKGMSMEQTLTALQGSRLRVVREYRNYQFLTKPGPVDDAIFPKGLPTLSRIEKILQEAGHTVQREDGYLVDEREYGWVRVRRGGHQNNLDDLKKVLPLFQQNYAAMMTVGTGHYSWSGEIQIMPLPDQPGTPDKQKIFGIHRGDSDKKPLWVSQAMVRADVWDAILKLPFCKNTNYSQVREEIQKEWVEATTEKETSERDLWLKQLKKEHNSSYAVSLLHKGEVPLLVGLAEHFKIVVARHRLQPFSAIQITEFLDDVAAYAYLHDILYYVRYWFRPSFSCGPQFGDFEKHQLWHQTLMSLSKKLYKAANRY